MFSTAHKVVNDKGKEVAVSNMQTGTEQPLGQALARPNIHTGFRASWFGTTRGCWVAQGGLTQPTAHAPAGVDRGQLPP